MNPLFSVSVPTSAEIFPSAAAVLTAALQNGVASHQEAVVGDVIRAVLGAEQLKSTLTLHLNGDGQLELSQISDEGRLDALAVWNRVDSSGASSAGGDPRDLAAAICQALASAREVADQASQRQSVIRSMEAEIEETNRGVMALYAELDERADKLRRADELKSRFLSYASHELRTPLNGIVGLVRLLESAGRDRPAEELKQLRFIQRAAEDLREIVNDLLDLAKVEAGKITVYPSEFGLDFVFGALRGIFRPLLNNDNVVLAFEDTTAVPAIYSDEAKVSQILRNFISNALKFTEQGTIRVWAELEGANVHISVADTGIGIDPAQQELIFEDFTQLDSEIQRRVRGTGLGLPLCRKLAGILGGKVRVQSGLGQGSTFSLILPRTYQASNVTGTPVAERTSKRTRLLVVDDMEIDRYLLTNLITAAGDYDILQTEDGRTAIDTVRKELPDLVFLDLNMPRIDGYSVLSEVRSDPTTRHIPVIIVTAKTLTDDDFRRLNPVTQGILRKDDLALASRMDIDLTGPVKVVLT